jgi:hypothetical protein
LGAQSRGQQLDSTLQFFAPLVGPIWVGQYVESPEEAHIQHIVQWQAMLGGKVVKKVKAVATLDFCEVSLHYWDPGNERVTFVSVTNRGQVATGSVRQDSGHMVLSGDRAVGASFVLSFAVLPDGRLQDRYFNVVDGSLKQGHLIEYSAESGEQARKALECEIKQ